MNKISKQNKKYNAMASMEFEALKMISEKDDYRWPIGNIMMYFT